MFGAQDKRRLEREKTYYWGQAEELRMAAAAAGRVDPTNEADHLQLTEQARELVEENRELRQRVQVMTAYLLGVEMPAHPLLMIMTRRYHASVSSDRPVSS